MKKLITTIITGTLLLGSTAFAMGNGQGKMKGKNMSLNDFKSMVLNKAEMEGILMTSTQRTCVFNASTKQAVKACNPNITMGNEKNK